jgi:hypothetical protein
MANRARRLIILAGGLLAAAGVVGIAADQAPATAQELVQVWKSASCGCCGDWISHMQATGFKVEAHDVDDLAPVKRAQSVPQDLGSCHTAVVGGYVIEGHVPADDVKRLLAERPAVKGLSAPGMPADAPGMNMQTGQAYDVISFGGPGGARERYARH